MTFIKVAVLAKELGVGEATVYQWCKKYDLPHYKPPMGGLRIDRNDFEKWFQKFKSKGRVHRLF